MGVWHPPEHLRDKSPLNIPHTPPKLGETVEEIPLERTCDKSSHFLAQTHQRFLPELSASFSNRGKIQKVSITGKRYRNEQTLCHLWSKTQLQAIKHFKVFKRCLKLHKKSERFSNPMFPDTGFL